MNVCSLQILSFRFNDTLEIYASDSVKELTTAVVEKLRQFSHHDYLEAIAFLLSSSW